LVILFLSLDRQRGVTCLREAASAKAGGRFLQQYVFSIMDSLVAQKVHDIPIESLWGFDRGQVADTGIGQEFGALNVCA
jgi:hypothetical protein